MRDRAHHRQLWGLLALAALALVPGQPGHAAVPAPVVELEETHAAGRLAVAGLVGSLQIERHDGAGIRLILRGSEAALGRLRREVRGDLLQLTAEPGPGGTTVVTGTNTVVTGDHTVVTGAGNVVIARNGGRATQIIGGSVTTVDSAAEPPLEVRAYVPAAAPLAVTGLVGDLVVDGVGGPVEIELIGGQATLDRVSGGRLTAVAGSRIELGAATGDLAVTVQGAGEVEVGGADLGALEVTVTGTGDVTVGGRAERASVRIAGVGAVAIDEVLERPEIRVAGVGRVEIGNW